MLEPTDALLIANTFLEVYSLLKDIGLFLKSSKRGDLKKLFGSKKETIERKFVEEDENLAKAFKLVRMANVERVRNLTSDAENVASARKFYNDKILSLFTKKN